MRVDVVDPKDILPAVNGNIRAIMYVGNDCGNRSTVLVSELSADFGTVGVANDRIEPCCSLCAAFSRVQSVEGSSLLSRGLRQAWRKIIQRKPASSSGIC